MVAATQDKALTLALDAMGGDHAPACVVEGAAIARRKYPNLQFIFFGDEGRTVSLIKEHPELTGCCEVVHTDKKIGSAEKVATALRQGRDSSMRLAIDAVKDGRADGVVSAGNTGAFMATAKMVFKTLEGINRPAIATAMPSFDKDTVMLDLGANVSCDATDLYQFAIIGDAYARTVLKHSNPAIGLLNIGSEDTKGHEEIQQAAQKLRDNQIGLNYAGFVEGDQILSGDVAVVVADGFTGNVALKAIEGTGTFIKEMLAQTFSATWMGKFSYIVSRPSFRLLKKRLDPRRYNGGLFLGLNHVAVKSHGGADGYAFYFAIREAVMLLNSQINERIMDELAAQNTIRNGKKTIADSHVTASEAAL